MTTLSELLANRKQAINVTSSEPALTITQTGTGNALVVEDAASDATPFVIDASGNIGVGVTTAFANNKFSVSGGDTDASSWFLKNSADVNGYELRLLKNRNTNVYANTAVNSGDILGSLSFGGNDGTNYRLGASILSAVDNTPGTNDMPCRLVFSTTADGASNPTERMRIDSVGKTKFTGGGVSGEVVRVSSSTTDSYLIIDQADASATNTARPVISLRKQNTTLFQISADGEAANSGATYYEAFTATGKHVFYTNGVERMRIDTSGNVGIGVSPAYRFDALTAAGRIGFTNSAGSNRITSVNAANSATVGLQLNALSYALLIGGTETLVVDSSGNVTQRYAAGLGYGTGAGGTVTQATSKSTPVTLNKPCGQITMNNAALAAGASISFQVNNSLVGAADVIIPAVTGFGNYKIVCRYISVGLFVLELTNISAGSLSEAVVLNFAIIKGATA